MAERYRHFTVEPLADGVWAALHRMEPPAPDAWAMSNAGIVELGGRTLVFDAFMTTPAAAELRAAAEELTGRPPSLVVLSHAHNDHVWGMGELAGATFVSSVGARAELAAEGAAEIRAYRDVLDDRLIAWRARAAGDDPHERADADVFLPYWEGLAETLPSLELHLPEIAVDGRLDVHGSDRRVEIATVGPAHSRGDLVMVVPDERIAFCGDLLFVGCHPYLGDGEVAGLRAELARLVSTGADRFVPGHGPVGGVDEIATLGRYVDDVERLAAAGDTEVPAAYRSWRLRRFFAPNLEFAAPRSADGG